VQTRAGEYFGLVDPYGIIEEYWDQLPESQTVIVTKYDGLWGKYGIEVRAVQARFRRDSLKLKRDQDLAERQIVKNLFNNTNNEEATMANANDIITIAKTGDVKKTEDALQSAIGQAVKRALWVAEKKDEFMAIPVLQELDAKYNPSGAKANPVVEIKDAKDIKLVKNGNVDDRVWSAILKKAGKLGAVRKSTGNTAEISIPKKEAETFIKAVQAVKGIAIS